MSTNISCKAHCLSSLLTDLDIDDEPAMEILMTGVDLRPQEGTIKDRGPEEKSTYQVVMLDQYSFLYIFPSSSTL